MSADVFASYRDLTVAGGPLRVYGAGDAGYATPVVLLHGAMLDVAALTWRHLMPLLGQDRRVVAVDLPRHGGSRPWRGTLDHRRMVEIVAGLLDQLGLERVDLVGQSMGSSLALGFALRWPQRVRRLVLAGPGGLDTVRPWQFVTWLFLRSALLQRWTAARLGASPRMLRRSLTSSLTAGESTEDFTEIVALAEAEATARRAHRESAMDDWQTTSYGPRRMRLCLLPDLPELAVPSLWLRGGDDPLVPAEVFERAVAAAPGATAVTVDDAGHLLPLDQPDRFNELVLTFLHGHEPER